MSDRVCPSRVLLGIAALLVSCFGASGCYAQDATGQPSRGASNATVVAALSAKPTTAVSLPSSRDWQARQGQYYKRNWGVEIIGVKPVSSGLMLVFKYRVLDPEKAKLLNDSKTRAFLRDEATGNVYMVPAMENIGELRTGAAQEADRTYFMIFGNPGKLVKSGSRVSIVAGALHVDNMIVD